MAACLSVCGPSCEDTDLRQRSYSLLFQIAARLFDNDKGKFDPSHYIALRAMEVGQVESQKFAQGESVIQDSEAEAIVGLVKAFSTQWMSSPNSTDALILNWDSLPVFESVMETSLKVRPQFVANACRQYVDDIATALYDPMKRWYAMQIMEKYTVEGRPLYEDDGENEIINPATLKRLEEWSKGLLVEEAEELEDEVTVVAQWVCKDQMNDVETWHDDDDINDDVACGRMLSWLSFLQIVDTASDKDSVNRPAFSSYISKCHAVVAMLDLAVVYGNIGTERKVKLEKVVPLDTILYSHSHYDGRHLGPDLSKLASLTIFRTVEVFPTLSKAWWEMHCPSYLTNTVQEFVEAQVSPEIMKRAVESTKQATAFGEMNVRGSSVTREITATYVQDDFTLSVMIKLPPAFPFRRAEVDCSKTLGVPPSRWKHWSLQITQMLNLQGGTVKDALLLWKENVDKEFEGVEPCPVCYSVLHVKTHKLPNMECKTCHNQFHSDCLFEWFRSSGKNACVLCQQPWSGTRV